MKISTEFDRMFENRGINVWFNTLGHTNELVNQFVSETQHLIDQSPIPRSDAVKHECYEQILGQSLVRRVKRTGFEAFGNADIAARRKLATDPTAECRQDPLIEVEHGGTLHKHLCYVNLLQQELRLVNAPRLLYLSGGLDSELVARILLAGEIDFQPIIFRWVDTTGNVANSEDIHYAEEFCAQHLLNPTRMEINLSSLWESDEFYEYMTTHKFRSPQLATYAYMIDQIKCQYPSALHLFGGEVRYMLASNVVGPLAPRVNLVFASKSTIPYVFRSTVGSAFAAVVDLKFAAGTAVKLGWMIICGGGGGGGGGKVVMSGNTIVSAHGGGGGGGGGVFWNNQSLPLSVLYPTTHQFAYKVGWGGGGGKDGDPSWISGYANAHAFGGKAGKSVVNPSDSCDGGQAGNGGVGPLPAGWYGGAAGGLGSPIGVAYNEIKKGTPYTLAQFKAAHPELNSTNVDLAASWYTSCQGVTFTGSNDFYGLGRAPDSAGLIYWATRLNSELNPITGVIAFEAAALSIPGSNDARRAKLIEKRYMPGKYGGDFIDLPRDNTSTVSAEFSSGGGGGGGGGGTNQGQAGFDARRAPLAANIAIDFKGAGGAGGYGIDYRDNGFGIRIRSGSGGGGGSAIDGGLSSPAAVVGGAGSVGSVGGTYFTAPIAPTETSGGGGGGGPNIVGGNGAKGHDGQIVYILS